MEKHYIKNDNNRMENPCLPPCEGKKRGRRGEEEGKKRLRRGREEAWHAESRAKAGLKRGLRLKVLRVAAVLAMMVFVGMNSAWATDYWYFIVNKSGKIVTYAKTTNQNSNTNANASAIPAAIKSVNATNWRFYNGDQLASNLTSITLPDGLPQITHPGSSYVVDCSSWGTVTLVDNPTTMTKLSHCESSTRYPNCIFVFCDYDENSVPDLRNGIYYTMQSRGGYTKNSTTYDPTYCYLYYNTSNNRMASTANYSGSHPVTNPVDSLTAVSNSQYLWYFKAAEVDGVVDPYDVKIYNAYVGIGDNHYFVANPLDAGGDGVGSGPENENNKLQPRSILNSDKIASYYIASSSYSEQYNITGKPAYNQGNGNASVQNTIYYNLWAEYQHDGNTTANISKGGITSQSNFQRGGGRKNFASIILTKVSKTYIIVDASGNTIAQALTLSNTLDVPDVIKSPFASYTYYGTQADAIAGTNPINSVTSTTIYVRYTTQSGDFDFNGGTNYFIRTNDNYLYAASSTTIGIESSLSNPPANTRKWKITGNDAYQLTIQNVDNSQYVTYDVSSGEAVPTLSGTGSKFFFHQSTPGQYEVVAITSSGYYSTNYYSMGVANSTLKLYSSSSYAMGDDEVQSVIYSLLTCETPVISFDNTTSQVTISCATEGATIHYTTNGDEPTSSSQSTPNPFTINTTTTVKAIATLAGYLDSDMQQKTIEQVAMPSIQDNGNHAISITCETEGAIIYYTTEGSGTPNIPYTGPLPESFSGVPIRAYAVKDNMINSTVVSETVKLTCDAPVITRNGNSGFIATCAFPSSGVTIYYTTDGSTTPTTSTPTHINSGESVTIALPVTVKAIAVATNYNNSTVTTTTVTQGMGGSGTEADPYTIQYQSDVADFVSKANTASEASKYYKVISATPLNFGSAGVITQPFSGNFDGNLQTLTGLTHSLFNTVSGGIVKNVILDDVSISSGTNVGTICNEANGEARIYNCGILSGEVGGTNYVGGLVGLLDGSSRVINCYSFADITSGAVKAGIVGYNNYASAHNDIKTMVMNCMFYGDIDYSSGSVYPIYGGKEIKNEDTEQLNNYNYFLYEADYSQGKHITFYNRALAAEERYLVRFEFYRYMLNSTRELASWYIFGSVQTDAHDKIHKWVLDKTIAPYPILKEQGTYSSVVNYDPDKTFDSGTGQMVNRTDITDRNKGKNLGALTVNITLGSGAPSGAAIRSGMSQITLQRTDKDYDDYNFNYDKVQLPYYNEVGTGNCTHSKVVTGWKITGMTGGTQGTFTEGDQWDGYNFADRSTYAKDLYGTSGRVFSQGAYFDVPDGVTAINIEPYWGNAAYMSDAQYDCYGYGMSNGVTDFGTRYVDGNNYSICGDQQPVYTSLENVRARLVTLGMSTSTTVYDNAIVLVGNFHYNQPAGTDRNDNKPFTIMSADLDEDNEPDYSFILNTGKDVLFYPVRFDFVNAIGTAMAHKKSGTYMGIIGTMKWAGWLEVTNTCLIRFSQLNRESEKRTKTEPLILLGGVVEQIVSTNGQEHSTGKTNYMHFGSNVWFKMFSNGCHADKTDTKTPHVPISLTGGDYDVFYLSGYFQPDAPYDPNDHAECYISGGRFGEVAGSGQEKIDGNVRWLINRADINYFYGGGINSEKPISGDIQVDILNSTVGVYCGGPKFGNMDPGKIVLTNATGCTFDTYYGAGNGGTALVRQRQFNNFNKVDYNWKRDVDYSAGHEVDITNSFVNSGGAHERGKYVSAKGGIAVNYEYEHFEGTNDKTVGRFYVNYASLSLAQTNDVTSVLEGCTINHNFYGGGKLGKVAGNVTSTLNNCTVYGSVFGAGYSSTATTVEVFAKEHFAPEPLYNRSTGVFESGGLPTAVPFTWSREASLSSSNTLDVDNHLIWTDVNFDDLGTVSNATLTIKGNSVIGTEGDSDTGNVFGGGDQSAVTGNTTVKLQGNAHVLGNVYGGGNEGPVGGDSKVEIQDP